MSVQILGNLHWLCLKKSSIMSDAASTFQFLLSKLIPEPSKAEALTTRSEDTIIAARIRPILPSETESGQVEGVLARNDSTIDLHELRRGMRGAPRLQASPEISNAGYVIMGSDFVIQVL
jgi:hypothetical protein